MIENLNKKIVVQKNEFLNDLNSVSSLNDAINLKNKYLKKYIKSLYSDLKNIVSPEEKKSAGKCINNFKIFVEEKFTAIEDKFKTQKSSLKYDVSICNGNIKLGSAHPLMKFYKKIEEVCISMGFSVVQGPEIEIDKYNFEMLNIPAHHPARDMQDTFYISHPTIS